MGLIEHIESFLGKISEGWKDNDSDNGLQVVAFREAQSLAETVYMTVGLSRHELVIGENKKVRQELVLPIQGTSESDAVVSLLLALCEQILNHHLGLLRGQVLRLSTDEARVLGFEAVYCALPVFLDPTFATFRGSEPPTVIVWVVPIYSSEAAFVDAHGWSAFEELLESKDANLLLADRQAIV